jgi:hypothetical protein
MFRSTAISTIFLVLVAGCGPREAEIPGDLFLVGNWQVETESGQVLKWFGPPGQDDTGTYIFAEHTEVTYDIENGYVYWRWNVVQQPYSITAVTDNGRTVSYQVGNILYKISRVDVRGGADAILEQSLASQTTRLSLNRKGAATEPDSSIVTGALGRAPIDD